MAAGCHHSGGVVEAGVMMCQNQNEQLVHDLYILVQRIQLFVLIGFNLYIQMFVVLEHM